MLYLAAQQNQVSYKDADKVRDVTFFVVVGCKLSKRHYFSGLSLDIEAVFLNSTFYFSVGFFFCFQERTCNRFSKFNIVSNAIINTLHLTMEQAVDINREINVTEYLV